MRITARAERDLGNLPDKVAAACVEFIFARWLQTRTDWAASCEAN
jgi:hypothetical protein